MQVSGVSGVQRSSDDIKKKWRNVSSETKKKRSTARKESMKTGGGVSAAKELNPTELKVAETMGQTATEGIPGWFDSEQPPTCSTAEYVQESERLVLFLYMLRSM